MPRAKAIMLALAPFRETAESAALSQSGKLIASACDQLMNIALMSNVKYNVVMRRGKNAMNRQGQLDHAKV